jgi:hypothetical protein
MRVQSSTRFVALAALAGALACAGNKARTDDGTQPEQAAAARDTTTGQDTLNGQNQNPPGYRGMERDTSIAPQHQQTPTDTFLQRQGTGAPQDTAGYSGMERVDTTSRQGNQQGQANPSQTDTSGNANQGAGQDTTGMSGMDSTQMQGDSAGANGTSGASNNNGTSNSGSTGAVNLDSTGMSRTGDTTGYTKSQQQDSTSR